MLCLFRQQDAFAAEAYEDAFSLAATADGIGGDLGEPLVIALLVGWITLSYVLGGLLAWWYRRESRSGLRYANAIGAGRASVSHR